MTQRDDSDSRFEAIQRRPDRVERAQRLVREAAELLSMQVNDEQMIGGVLEGIRDAEQSCRNALRSMAWLATSRDVRR